MEGFGEAKSLDFRVFFKFFRCSEIERGPVALRGAKTRPKRRAAGFEPPTTPRPQATGKSPPYLRAGPLPVVNPMRPLELQRIGSTGFLQTLRLDLKTKFCAQEWPKEGPSRPQTFPNGAQDRSKFNFLSTFGAIFSHVKFVLIWYSFFRGILHFLKRSSPIKHCVGAVFLKISVF